MCSLTGEKDILRKRERSEAAVRCQPLLEWQNYKDYNLISTSSPWVECWTGIYIHKSKILRLSSPVWSLVCHFSGCPGKGTRNCWKYFVVPSIVWPRLKYKTGKRKPLCREVASSWDSGKSAFAFSWQLLQRRIVLSHLEGGGDFRIFCFVGNFVVADPTLECVCKYFDCIRWDFSLKPTTIWMWLQLKMGKPV